MRYKNSLFESLMWFLYDQKLMIDILMISNKKTLHKIIKLKIYIIYKKECMVSRKYKTIHKIWNTVTSSVTIFFYQNLYQRNLR